MNFNLKLKKIRTFRKMTQKELSEKIGLTDQHRIVQYEKGVRVPKKDLVDKMAQALDVNPYTLYDTAGRDASEMMELLFWLDEFNPSALHLFLPRKFPGEKCNEVADTSVYYHDNDSWPAHAPVCMWFDYGVLNNFLKTLNCLSLSSLIEESTGYVTLCITILILDVTILLNFSAREYCPRIAAE